MADVALLWFMCKNPNCNFIPIRTKKEKIKRYWQHGNSIQLSARARVFMRYVEGHYQWLDSGNLLIFNCKYGRICMYDHFDTQDVNGFISPIKGQIICDQCITKIDNERRLMLS